MFYAILHILSFSTHSRFDALQWHNSHCSPQCHHKCAEVLTFTKTRRKNYWKKVRDNSIVELVSCLCMCVLLCGTSIKYRVLFSGALRKTARHEMKSHRFVVYRVLFAIITITAFICIYLFLNKKGCIWVCFFEFTTRSQQWGRTSI